MANDHPTPRTRAEAFKALVKDTRISSGAFRFWHVLYYHTDRDTGESFPGYQTIQEWTGCDTHCLPRWREELIRRGWLMFKSERATKKKHGHRYRYLLLDGCGHPFFKAQGDGETNHTVTVKPTTARVTVKPPSRRRRNQPQSDVETTVVTKQHSSKECVVQLSDVGSDSGSPATYPPSGAGSAPLRAPAAPTAKRRINSFPDDTEELPV